MQELIARRTGRPELHGPMARPAGRRHATTLASGPDLSELYRANAEQLRQIVRFSIRAPDAVIDDACQVAWSRLVGRRGELRRDAVMGWLVTTASREALRLLRRARRELPLEALAQPGAIAYAAPDQIVEFRERLDQIGALSRRQQRLVWLHGFGLTYAEMASYTGDTERTIERQILRAKRALRRA